MATRVQIEIADAIKVGREDGLRPALRFLLERGWTINEVEWFIANVTSKHGIMV